MVVVAWAGWLLRVFSCAGAEVIQWMRRAAVALLFISYRRRGRLTIPRLRRLPGLAALGLTGVFGYNYFFFKGLQIIEAGRAAAVIALYPIVITLLSAIFFRERLRSVQVLGILLSVSGALVVISRGEISGMISHGVGLGEILILGCVFSWSIYSLIGKLVMARFSPLDTVPGPRPAAPCSCLFPPCWRACVQGRPPWTPSPG